MLNLCIGCVNLNLLTFLPLQHMSISKGELDERNVGRIFTQLLDKMDLIRSLEWQAAETCKLVPELVCHSGSFTNKQIQILI